MKKFMLLICGAVFLTACSCNYDDVDRGYYYNRCGVESPARDGGMYADVYNRGYAKCARHADCGCEGSEQVVEVRTRKIEYVPVVKYYKYSVAE